MSDTYTLKRCIMEGFANATGRDCPVDVANTIIKIRKEQNFAVQKEIWRKEHFHKFYRTAEEEPNICPHSRKCKKEILVKTYNLSFALILIHRKYCNYTPRCNKRIKF